MREPVATIACSECGKAATFTAGATAADVATLDYAGVLSATAARS